MDASFRRQVLSYALAPALAAAATALTGAAVGPLGGAYLYFPLLAVFVSALQGGLGPGLVTLVLCAGSFDWFFLGTPRGFGVDDAEQLHRLLGFVVAALIAASISARYRRARIAAEEAREEARRIGQLQETLVAVVGHDLRNPLASLRAGLDVLARMGGLDDRQRMVVTRMRGSALRMERLIEDVLGFARSRKPGTFPLLLAPARVGEVCDHAISELRDAYPDRTIRLDVEGDDEALLDAPRLEQVASNLVANAVKHGSPSDPVEVHVRGLADEVVLEVANRGAPIPRESMPRVFEPFWSGDRNGHGVGLGLFVVSQVVSAHGGRVNVRSDRGLTAFEVRLPRRPHVPA